MLKFGTPACGRIILAAIGIILAVQIGCGDCGSNTKPAYPSYPTKKVGVIHREGSRNVSLYEVEIEGQTYYIAESEFISLSPKVKANAPEVTAPEVAVKPERE